MHRTVETGRLRARTFPSLQYSWRLASIGSPMSGEAGELYLLSERAVEIEGGAD